MLGFPEEFGGIGRHNIYEVAQFLFHAVITSYSIHYTKLYDIPMAKTGRPLSDDPSQHRISVRLTESEYELLKKYVEAHDLTMTRALKLGIELLYKSSQK